MNNGEIWSVCIIYYIQTELPRRCSEMSNGEVRSRLYYILYTDRVTSPLFGNEQWPGRSVYIVHYIQAELHRRCSEMSNGEVKSVCIIYYIQTEFITSRLFRNTSTARFGSLALFTIYRPSYPAVVRK